MEMLRTRHRVRGRPMDNSCAREKQMKLFCARTTSKNSSGEITLTGGKWRRATIKSSWADMKISALLLSVHNHMQVFTSEV
ncbi:hypothetical protein KIN20_000651 [Parelaphostrongylus tenuis]|uniref:Uncharacterized protein n=1 Tax=Parelaphostrongylus tenuis TaxID=148309 RepID=A0AAD5LV35_PARTN|nr:hypothetical protein KIN20_000651 [Parelaphostrongylus tenuis]